MGKAGQMTEESVDEYGMTQGESAIDTTLDEIQSLRIINEALEALKQSIEYQKQTEGY